MFRARKVSPRAENEIKPDSHGEDTPESPAANTVQRMASPHVISYCNFWETLHSSNPAIILLNPKSSHLNLSPCIEEDSGSHKTEIPRPVIYPKQPPIPKLSPSSSPRNIVGQNGPGYVALSVICPETFPVQETGFIAPRNTGDGSESRPILLSPCIPTLGSNRKLTHPHILGKPLPHKGKSLGISPRQHLIPNPSRISSSAIEEQRATSVSSTFTACPLFPSPYSQNFIRPTDVYTQVNEAPYQPPVYPVSVLYDQHPIITNVTGNYLAHPAPKPNQKNFY